jgi:flagellar assembly protein FliH
MIPWRDSLTLPERLRDIVLIDPPAPSSVETRVISEEELRASYQRGREDGEKAMSEQLLRQRAELHEVMRGVVTSMRNAIPQMLREAENTLISLSLVAAQKLVADLPISTAMVEAVVRDALAQVEGAAQFTVRLHSADLELLQKSDSPLLSPAEQGADFRFLSSPEVTRGGCLIQTHFGTVDARRETKFDLLQRSMLA